MTDTPKSQGHMEEVLKGWGKKLDVLKERLDHLKSKAGETRDEVKEEFEEKIEDLTNKRDAMQERVTALRNSSGEAWESTKGGVESAWTDLSTALEEAISKFK